MKQKKIEDDDLKRNDADDDDDDDADQLGNGAQVGDANGGDYATMRQRTAEPKRRYELKKTGPQTSAPKRRQGDSAGEQGTQIAKRPVSK